MAEPYAPLLTRKKLLGGGEESSAGTAATITTPLDSTILYDIKIELQDVMADGERTPDGNYLGSVDSLAGKKIGKLTFKQELRNGDKFVPMLTGAGYSLTSTTYSPTSSMGSRKTWSFAVWEGGRRKGIKGATGTCKISGTNGQRVFAEWEWTGIWIAPIDEAMPSQAPITGGSYLCSAMTLTIGAAAVPLVSKFEIDLGNEISEREDVTTAGGVLHTLIHARQPQLTLDHEARLVAQNDAYGALVAGTTAALSLVLTSGSATLTIAAPRVQRTQITSGDRNGRLTDDTTYKLRASSGDDELTFTEDAGS